MKSSVFCSLILCVSLTAAAQVTAKRPSQAGPSVVAAAEQKAGDNQKEIDAVLAELKAIAQDRDVAQVFAKMIDVLLRFFAETFEQEVSVMFGCENLRTFGVNLSVAHPDLIDLVHQLGDKIEIETGDAESRDLLFRRENHLGVLNRVIEIVLLHGIRIGDRHLIANGGLFCSGAL